MSGFALLLGSVLAAILPDAAAAALPDAVADNPYRLIDRKILVVEFARCIYDQAPQKVHAVLATAVDSPEEAAQIFALVNSKLQCLKDRPSLSFEVTDARGAFAEVALSKDTALAARLAMLAPVDMARPTVRTGRAFVFAYGQCLAAKAPAQARALLATGHGSPEERAAVMGFDTALSDCMPSDLAYQINIGDVRDHVAAALYDRTMAVSGGGDVNA